jgi:hypothetical protein
VPNPQSTQRLLLAPVPLVLEVLLVLVLEVLLPHRLLLLQVLLLLLHLAVLLRLPHLLMVLPQLLRREDSLESHPLVHFLMAPGAAVRVVLLGPAVLVVLLGVPAHHLGLVLVALHSVVPDLVEALLPGPEPQVVLHLMDHGLRELQKLKTMIAHGAWEAGDHGTV